MAGPRRPPGKKPRSTGTSGRDPKKLSQRVKTARGRRLSSTRWLERQLNDPFVSRAKLEGYRSRSQLKEPVPMPARARWSPSTFMASSQLPVFTS